MVDETSDSFVHCLSIGCIDKCFKLIKK